jgi:hypothetical protein
VGLIVIRIVFINLIRILFLIRIIGTPLPMGSGEDEASSCES